MENITITFKRVNLEIVLRGLQDLHAILIEDINSLEDGHLKEVLNSKTIIIESEIERIKAVLMG